jgi:glucokinase
VIAAVADIGGTRIKLALVANNKIIAEAEYSSDPAMGLKAALSDMAARFSTMLRNTALSPQDCAGIGFGFPGLVDPRQKRVLTTYGKFDDAPTLDLPNWAKSEFDLPFMIESDSRAALQGERVAGAGRNCDDVVMLTLGTGLGTAAIVQGQMLYGAHLQAGILGGHVTVQVGGPKCICGNLGCAEALASTAVLHSRFHQHELSGSSALRECGTISYEDVFRLAVLGDRCAIELRAEAISVWAAAIVNLIHSYDPERVIVGGGIMSGANSFFDDLVGWVHKLAHTPWGRVEIVPAQLGTRAGVIGLASLVENYARENL